MQEGKSQASEGPAGREIVWHSANVCGRAIRGGVLIIQNPTGEETGFREKNGSTGAKRAKRKRLVQEKNMR